MSGGGREKEREREREREREETLSWVHPTVLSAFYAALFVIQVPGSTVRSRGKRNFTASLRANEFFFFFLFLPRPPGKN